MFAVIVNTITILIGASVGLLLRKGLPESVSDAMMKGLGLCTIFIGIQGMIEEASSVNCWMWTDALTGLRNG